MDEVVTLRCPTCHKERPYNFVKAYIYGFPRCCAGQHMVSATAISPELQAHAKSEAYLPPDARQYVWVDRAESLPLTEWRLKKLRRGMK